MDNATATPTNSAMIQPRARRLVDDVHLGVHIDLPPGDEAEDILIDGFRAAWRQVPPEDKKTLMIYWKRRQNPLLGYYERRPSIRIVDEDGAAPIIEAGGCRLIVPAGIADAQEPREVAHTLLVALATMYRFANGTHIRQWETIVDEPWQWYVQSMGGTVTEEMEDEVMAKLDERHARGYHAAVKRVAHRWRIWARDHVGAASA